MKPDNPFNLSKAELILAKNYADDTITSDVAVIKSMRDIVFDFEDWFDTCDWYRSSIKNYYNPETHQEITFDELYNLYNQPNEK